MKKFIYRALLTAFVLTAAFAFFSCEPAAGISGYNWDSANERNNVPGAVNDPEIPSGNTAVTNNNPEITVKFPPQADVLRASNVQEELNKFMTIHTYTTPDNYDSGNASVLSSPIDYKFVKTVGRDQLVVKVEREFTGTYSRLIVKINGQTYTHSNGLKVDVDLNGTGGEAGYDDIYLMQAITGADNSIYFRPAGGKGWYLEEVYPQPLISWSVSTPEKSNPVSSYAPIRMRLNGIPSDTDNGKAVYKAVGEQFAGGFKLQELVNGTWTTVKTAVYDANASIDYIVFEDFILDSAVPYRVFWSGSANLTTTNQYFGVNQRIYVDLGNFTSVRQAYNQTEASGKTMLFTNSRSIVEIMDVPSISLHSFDSNNRRAVADVEFPILGSGTAEDPYVGLKRLQLSDFQGDNAAFKIITQFTGDILDKNHHSIRIINVEYFARGELPDGSVNNSHFNVIRMALDPNVVYPQEIHYLINDTFRYEGTTPLRIFGDRRNYAYGNYRHYFGEILEEGVTKTGVEVTAATEKVYSFNVTGGNLYRIVLNANNNINVTARYRGINEQIFNTGFFSGTRVLTVPLPNGTVTNGTVELSVTSSVNSTFSIGYTELSEPRLQNSLWFDGEFTNEVSSYRFVIPVNSGATYYFWQNIFYEEPEPNPDPNPDPPVEQEPDIPSATGDGSKTLGVDLEISGFYFIADTSVYFIEGPNSHPARNLNYADFNNTARFESTENGWVVITIEPSVANELGTFGLVYNTDNNRPPLE